MGKGLAAEDRGLKYLTFAGRSWNSSRDVSGAGKCSLIKLCTFDSNRKPLMHHMERSLQHPRECILYVE